MTCKRRFPMAARRHVLVTGANSGVGLGVAKAAAAEGCLVYVACRSRERGEEACRAVGAAASKGGGAEFVKLDLADWKDVLACAETLKRKAARLDAVCLNAGIAKIGSGFAGPRTDKQGIDVVASFLFGHALLVRALQPLLERTAAREGRVRVLWTSSIDHWTCASSLDDNGTLEHCRGEMDGKLSYRVCKLGHIQAAFALSRRFGKADAKARIEHVAYTPGLVHSNFIDRSGLDIGKNMWLLKRACNFVAVPSRSAARVALFALFNDRVKGGDMIMPYSTLSGLTCWDGMPFGKRGLNKFKFEVLQRTNYWPRVDRASPEANDEREQEALLRELERVFRLWAGEHGIALEPSPWFGWMGSAL